MLTMDQQKCIRMMRQWLGLSLAEIEEMTDLNFRTVKKYADDEIRKPAERESERPVIGPYEETIDLWLEEDLTKKATQRRNAQDIFEQLEEETDYDGSARTVRRYVSKAKDRIVQARATQFVKLDHPPGEAQIDFGEVWVWEPEKESRSVRKLLLATLPYSNARFGILLPAENIECLLWGLKKIFEQIGAVPLKLVFDNLTPVVSINNSTRKLTDMFKRFQTHYGFQVEFCNPASGNEKGHVENGISVVRHRHLTPLPVVEQNKLAPLNRELEAGLREDLKRKHHEKGGLIEELFREEIEKFLKLPDHEFEACRLRTRTASKVGEIQVDGETYHLPWTHPKQKVLVKLFWDHLEVFDEEQNKLGEVPREYKFRAEKVDWAAELKLLEHKPKALPQAATLDGLPEEIQEYLIEAPEDKRPERVGVLITLFESGYSVKEVLKAVRRGKKFGRLDEMGLKMVAGLDTDKNSFKEKVPDCVSGWKPDLSSYDGLLEAKKDE